MTNGGIELPHHKLLEVTKKDITVYRMILARFLTITKNIITLLLILFYIYQILIIPSL